MDPSFVGSQMSSDASSEQSSVRNGAGYDEVFGSGQKFDDFSGSSERETSAQSLGNDVEDYVEGVKEELVGKDEGEGESDGDEDEDEGDKESYEEASVSPRGNRPFILLEDWAVNKFLPKMSDRVFKELRTHFQIPDHISICLPRKKEKCYIGMTTDVSMYDAVLTAGLRLPLTALHRQLVDFMGLSISQIAPNAWRTFIGAEVLWGRLSGRNRQLSLDEFFYCYKPRQIVSSKGTYHFSIREKDLRLVSNMPDSNRSWKSRYFFIKGPNWVCRSKKWVTMPHGFDNTWAIVKAGFNTNSFCFAFNTVIF